MNLSSYCCSCGGEGGGWGGTAGEAARDLQPSLLARIPPLSGPRTDKHLAGTERPRPAWSPSNNKDWCLRRMALPALSHGASGRTAGVLLSVLARRGWTLPTINPERHQM